MPPTLLKSTGYGLAKQSGGETKFGLVMSRRFLAMKPCVQFATPSRDEM